MEANPRDLMGAGASSGGPHPREDAADPAAGPPGGSRPGQAAREYQDLEGAAGREINFRQKRYLAHELSGLEPRFVLKDPGGREVSFEIRDLSGSGVAFYDDGQTILQKDLEVAEVVLRFLSYEAYRGRARIASTRTEAGRVVWAASFLDGLIHMDTVIRLCRLKADEEAAVSRFRADLALWQPSSCLDFKGLMGEFRLFLDGIRTELREIEPRVPWGTLNAEGNDPARKLLIDLFQRDMVAEYVRYMTDLDVAMRAAPAAETDRLKAFARKMLHEHVLESALFRRSFDKPLGYAGDYVIMTYIYGRNFEGSSLFAKYAHLASWAIPVCEAVRSRRAFVTRQIREELDRRKGNDRPFRILSVAAGPAEELYRILEHPDPAWPPLEIVLFDQDHEALDFCFRRLSALLLDQPRDRVRLGYRHDSIKHLLFEENFFAGRGQMDLVMCVGLYDYLPLRIGQALATKLYLQLAPGGTVFIGNMAPRNPSRFTMEYLAEWTLIYRSPDQVMELGKLLPEGAARKVVAEPTGINLFLVARRPDDGA